MYMYVTVCATPARHTSHLHCTCIMQRIYKLCVCVSPQVNLHFVLGSLYPDLTRGRGSQLSACPVATALLGLSDQFLVAVTTAALTLQYLLTCPPAMELEDRGGEALSLSLSLSMLYCALSFVPPPRCC